MTHIFHFLVAVFSTGYLLLIFLAGGAFLYFLFSSSSQQDQWNALNLTDPEDDFQHTSGFEMRGY